MLQCLELFEFLDLLFDGRLLHLNLLLFHNLILFDQFLLAEFLTSVFLDLVILFMQSRHFLLELLPFPNCS